jgi:ABC-type branched-subunit amino acid transport system ATPase component
MLIIRNLYAGYKKDSSIINGLNLHITKGKAVGILGRNGSGKSTLAKAICGLVPFTKGDILLEGKSIVGLSSFQIARLGVGFFQQGGRVFPNLSVYENIVFAAGSLSKKEIEIRLDEIGAWFKFLLKTDRLKLNASYLSGGEKHQLALAMVMIQKPKFLILDEPSAGLSPSNQKTIYQILQGIKESTKTTLLIIEQNKLIVKDFCDELVLLKCGKVFNGLID